MPTGDYLTQLGKEISISLAILLAVPQKKMREFGGFRCLLLLFQFCLLNIAGYITLSPGDFVAPRFQSAVVESRFDTKPKPTGVQCATPCPVQKVAREELYSNRSKAQSLCYPMCVLVFRLKDKREARVLERCGRKSERESETQNGSIRNISYHFWWMLFTTYSPLFDDCFCCCLGSVAQ